VHRLVAEDKLSGALRGQGQATPLDVKARRGMPTVQHRRRSPLERRQGLIDATIQVIATHGIADCSLERVAAAAGVTHGLIRHHFGGKGALLVAAYQELSNSFLAALDAAVRKCNGNAMACLGAYIDIVHDPFSWDEYHALAWFGLWYEARSNPEVHAINREFQAEYLAYIENLVRMAAQERDIEVDVQRLARGLVALTDGLWQELMIDNTAFGTQIAREVCNDYLACHFDRGCKA